MSDFFDAIRRFLLDYLPKQRALVKIRFSPTDRHSIFSWLI